MMAHPRGVPLVAFILALVAGCEPGPTHSDSLPPPDTRIAAVEVDATATICTGQPVPSGYVVTGASFSPACPDLGGVPNQLTIRTLTSPMAICTSWRILGGAMVQQVPSGYLVIGVSSSPACPSGDDTPNTLTIRRPVSPMTICLQWPVPGGTVTQARPGGWFVVGASSSPACLSDHPASHAPNALTIRVPVSPASICTRIPVQGGFITQTIPPGYAVVGASSSSACPDAGGPYNVLQIQTSSSTSSICIHRPIPGGSVAQSVPEGYAVEGVSISSVCPYSDTYNKLEIRALAPAMSICTRWPVPGGTREQRVPAGYAVVGTSVSSACPDYGTYNVLQIQIPPPGSSISMCTASPVPGGFVIQPVPRRYVVVGVSNSSACPAYRGIPYNVLQIRALDPPSSMSMCGQWPVPSGAVVQDIPPDYLVVGASNSSECPEYRSGHNTLTIQPLAPRMSICTQWSKPGGGIMTQTVPPGYVVVGVSNSDACPQYRTIAFSVLEIQRVV